MFCISLKSFRFRLLSVVCGVVIVALLYMIVHVDRSDVAVYSDLLYTASSHEERMNFLEQFGWNVEADPVAVEEVFIPMQFGDVYQNYNELQIKQGFDLLPYAGKSVKKWVYAVTNYPGYAQSQVYIRATILVYGDRIIGGDICSVELNGFMHGFDYESKF